MKELEFFFDYASPWSYLASTQVDHVARRSHALLVHRPILLGGLFKHIGTPLVPLHAYSDAKRRHAIVDMGRWAHYWNVPFHFPSRFPLNTVSALRLTFLAGDDMPLLIDRIFEACWVEDRDPSDRNELGAILEELDLDRRLLDRMDAVETKAALRAATDGAVKRGICGAPTFSVDGRLFWGQDRLHFVEAALRGWRSVVESGR